MVIWISIWKMIKFLCVVCHYDVMDIILSKPMNVKILVTNKTKHNFYITSIGNGLALGNAFDRVASWKKVVNLWRRGREIKSQKEKRVLSKAGKSPSSYMGRTSPRLVKACPIRFYKCAFPFTFSIFTRLGRFIYRMHNQCLFLLFFFLCFI